MPKDHITILEKPLKFRKKPVVIEAILLTQELIDLVWKELKAKHRGPEKVESLQCTKHPRIEGIVCRQDFWHIITLEGDMRANPGNWIIRGVSNELYPCKPDIFDKTYEPA